MSGDGGAYRRDSHPGANPNMNVNWMNPSFWLFYVALILLCRGALWLVPLFPQEVAWTCIHVVLTGVQIYFFHWVKGTPFWGDSGAYDHLTFWEQIDGGVQYTSNRKVLTLVPVLVYLLACVETDWSDAALWVNTVCVLLAVLPKTGFMHRKRLGGINK